MNYLVYIIGIAISLIAVLPFPIEFYTFVRISIFILAIIVVFDLLKSKNQLWYLFAGIAILYNPIIPIYLYSKVIWSFFNIGTAASFFYAMQNKDIGFNPKNDDIFSKSFTESSEFQNRKNVNDLNSNSINSAKADVEKIIRRDFGYALDILFVKTFEKIVSDGLKRGKNEYDIAIKYMLVQINTMHPTKDQRTIDFVDLHTKNIMNIINRSSERSAIIEKTNEIRKKYFLPLF